MAFAGYLKDLMSGDANTDVGRDGVSRLTVRFMRLLIHSLLAVGCAALPGGAARAAQAIAPVGGEEKREGMEPHVAANWVGQRMFEDWSSLREALNVDNNELAIALHMTLSAMRRLAKGREVLKQPFEVC